MGQNCGKKSDEKTDQGDVPDQEFSAPPNFEDVLAALRPFHQKLGGTPHFPGHRRDPCIRQKLRKDQLAGSSDYEYAFVTVLGFQALQQHCDEIVQLNNGKFWRHNPGTVKLEEVSGFTMHGDREGANGIVKTGGDTLLRAFDLARRKRKEEKFFMEAFDKTADPCLEGRLGRLLTFIEKYATQADCECPPWEDLAVGPLPAGSAPEKVVGEHLRVFNNRCVWEWAQKSGLTYERAKKLWDTAGSSTEKLTRTKSGALLPEVAKLCNEETFSAYLLTTGVVEGHEPDKGPPPVCILPREAVDKAILFFVEMETLHPAPFS